MIESENITEQPQEPLTPADALSAPQHSAEVPTTENDGQVSLPKEAPSQVEDANQSEQPTEPQGEKPSGIRTVELKEENIDNEYQIRLPNVTLPGPVDGISVPLSLSGIKASDILEEEKNFDAILVRISGGMVTLFPKKEGEHRFSVPIQTKDGKSFAAAFLLTVNPDPKSLWKNIPVPEGTPFAKPDQDVFHSDDGTVRIVAASQRGRTHAQQGTCRDDDMAFWSDPATGRYILVVADGAGSAKFSRKGSKIAVETAVRELSEKLTDEIWASEGVDFSPEGNVCKVLVGAARTAVGDVDAFVKEPNAATESALQDITLKDFNTTLLMAVLKRNPDGSLRGATFSIGDGAIAWWQPGSARLLCAPDGGEFSGQTKFLTTLSVWKDPYDTIQKSRCFTFQKSPDETRSGRLFIMTDGVSDPFFETDNLLKNPAEWEKFETEQLAPLSLFSDSGADIAESASHRLLNWLSFWSVGNHDDRTIAVFGAAPKTPVEPPPSPSDREEAASSEPKKTSLLGRLFGHKS